MYDIAIVSVPFTVIEVPPLALAVLKGSVEHHGYSCKTYDLGMELFLSVKKERLLFEDVQLYFYQPDLVTDAEHKQLAINFIDTWARKLISLDTSWIGISVFSGFAQSAAFLLAKRIKELSPKSKIVIGGNGSSISLMDTAYNLFECSKLEKILTFGDFLKKRKIIDCVIKGDGEEALVNLLKESKIDESQFFYGDYNKTEFPFANFDDYKLEHYEGQKNRLQIPVFSSKGCVRNCDFCDVNSVQGFKYRFRTGENVAKEIIFLSKKYKHYEFYFTDSLANGSLKNLREMATILAEYNKQNPNEKITWTAQGWISRPPGQMKDDLYKLLAESGLDTVTIGVESGSNRVLKAMDKKTIIEGLHYDIEYFRKYNIKFIALIIVGHWAEKWEDFLETAKLFYQLAKYVRMGVLHAVALGQGYVVEDDQPAWINRDTKSKIIAHSRTIWWTPENPSLTFRERYLRWVLLHRLLHELKIPLTTEESLRAMWINLQGDLKIAQDWYTKYLEDQKFVSNAEYYFDNFNEFYAMIKEKAKDKSDQSYSLEFDVTVGHTKGLEPGLEIFYNNQKVFCKTFGEGNHTIKIENLKAADYNQIEINFINKQKYDTVTDLNGSIIKDKYIKLESFKIDDVDLTQDIEFFHENFKYYEDGIKIQPKVGFWIPKAKLTLNWPKNFLEYYNKHSKRFKKFDAYIVAQSQKPGARLNKIDPEEYRQKIVDQLRTLPV